MRHKNILYGAFVAVLCSFIIGMRAGAHDANLISAEEYSAQIAQYEEQIADLETQLALEREIEHVVIENVYTPLSVDYEIATDIVEDDAVLLAKTMWGEQRSGSYEQKASTAWCVLNRVDAGYGTIKEVCTSGAFYGYHSSNPVDADLYRIACDCLLRWQTEKIGVNTDVGRTIPSCYLWFEANGKGKNVFRNAYQGGERITP